MKKYPAYKDSRVEWIGYLPIDWKAIRLKYLMHNFDGKRIPLSADERSEMRGDYPYYGSNGIVDRVNNYLFEGEYILLGEDGSPFFEPCRDVAFLVSGKFWVNNHAHILKALQNHNQRFLTYSLNCVDYRKHITGSTRDKLTQDDMSTIMLPVTDELEQTVIANYLDRKTLQIDDLIAKKERMIELLKEERTAIINQAVTRGLDETVEFKDSGIEWLGEIPKHWEMEKLKFNASIRFSNVDKKTAEGEKDVRLCNYVNVYYNDFITLNLDFMEATASVEEIRKYQLNVNDVIVTKDSESWDDIAVPAYVAEVEDKLICGYHLAQIKSYVKILSGKFLFWMLSGNVFNHQYRIEATGVTRYGLSNHAFSNSFIVSLPINEQKKISDYLDKKTAQIHEQIECEKKSIELLKKYRTALISEVVTGKIDVRSGI